ncbi:DUF2914 domain-containing protein [Gammaproteobacteria bacterium AB-CW1]|uniref:DUF2914 domain-containing protein n=1 Tax=Natronospira elongata TaxID=3110268 RepID=A0AAP6JFT8_9GAMM|nr:DUF2914 domain-containing protein [Gammaproteobacteria bacterium AB-CW1]
MNKIKLTTGLSMVAVLALGLGSPVLADEHGVYRAQFTTAVEEREPVDEIEELRNDHELVLFFTEFRDMEGHTLTHRWKHDGDVEAEVELTVGGPRWRTWSSKRLVPEWTGTWTVEVVDEDGDVHGSWSFEYIDQDEPPVVTDDNDGQDDNGGDY